jgi:hypothetical protein
MWIPSAKRAQGPTFSLDYTPTAFVAAGSVVVIGGRVGVADQDIPANTLGALNVLGAYDVINDGNAVSDRQDQYWLTQPAVTISSITTTTTTATATTSSAHLLQTGQNVIVSGANQAAYNGLQSNITVTGSTTFTFTVPAGTTTPATGTMSVGSTTGGLLTPLASGNTYFGYADGAVASSTIGTTTTRVVMTPNGSAIATVGEIIADPGATNAIPITNSGIVNLVSAATETRTLAAPASAGLSLILNAQNVTAGTITVNSATTNVGSGSKSHIALSANGQAIELLSITSSTAGVYRWMVRGNDGTVLS